MLSMKCILFFYKIQFHEVKMGTVQSWENIQYALSQN